MMESKQAVHITATVSTNGNQEKLMMANGKTARNTEKENGQAHKVIHMKANMQTILMMVMASTNGKQVEMFTMVNGRTGKNMVKQNG